VLPRENKDRWADDLCRSDGEGHHLDERGCRKETTNKEILMTSSLTCMITDWRLAQCQTITIFGVDEQNFPLRDARGRFLYRRHNILLYSKDRLLHFVDWLIGRWMNILSCAWLELWSAILLSNDDELLFPIRQLLNGTWRLQYSWLTRKVLSHSQFEKILFDS